MQERINKIRTILQEKKADAFLITDIHNIRYLTNYSGQNALYLLIGEKGILITDSLYKQQIEQETKGFKIHIAKNGLYEEIHKRNLLKNVCKLAFESDVMSYNLVRKLKKLFSDKKFIPMSNVVESIASVKEDIEISYIKKAVEICDVTFNNILKLLRPGITENEISAEISYIMKKNGSECDAFQPIVASGINSSMPHAKPGYKKIKNNEPIMLDFGAIYRGYNSDMTRTVFLGKPDRDLKNIYQIVLDAQQFAIDKVKDGASCRSIDKIARDHITHKGFGKYFNHSSGHGLGLKMHNLPIVSSKSKDILRQNMVITIEPGIYFPGKFGVRIEDDVLVKKNGCEVLTKSDKDLIII